jgi:putative ATP-dependent endonuclease of the OLD family
MHIQRAIIENYRCLRKTEVIFNAGLNIIVGDNETGKSTLLEAVNLCLSGLLNGRGIAQELHPFLFNAAASSAYLQALEKGESAAPPTIRIEVFLSDDDDLQKLKGTINSRKEDCPGVTLSIEFDPAFAAEYKEFVADSPVRSIPIDFYNVKWRSFADNILNARSIPIKPTFIDTSAIRHNNQTGRYALELVRDTLNRNQLAELSLAYRKLRDDFSAEPRVKLLNDELAIKSKDVSKKAFSVSLDTAARTGWEAGIIPHLDDIPFVLAGKGEQSKVKLGLSISTATKVHVFLIEEPENHLSYHHLNDLIDSIAQKAGGKQLIVATHSSFVLNKLGIGNVHLFNGSVTRTLNDLDNDTRDYFMKLPGHDTLRMILAQKVILVEGPSDELVVQRAILDKYGTNALNRGGDVISVRSLAFKRFLAIAKLLKIDATVVIDNDGKAASLGKRYEDFKNAPNIRLCYDVDDRCPTLEPQLLKANSRAVLNNVLGTAHSTDDDLVQYMTENKTDCALKIFESKARIAFPQYIKDAIE